MRTYQPLCHLLVVRATGFDDCNREFAASFDSSWHPLFLWVAHVWQFGNSCCFVTVWWFMRLASVIVTVNSPHYLIRIGVLFLSRWRECCTSMWFDLKLLFFSFSFFLELCAGYAKNNTNPSIYFFFWFGPSFLIVICNCFIYIDYF